MTKKHFCKQLMAVGCDRNEAAKIAAARPEKESYKSYLARITRVAARRVWVSLIKRDPRFFYMQAPDTQAAIRKLLTES